MDKKGIAMIAIGIVAVILLVFNFVQMDTQKDTEAYYDNAIANLDMKLSVLDAKVMEQDTEILDLTESKLSLEAEVEAKLAELAALKAENDELKAKEIEETTEAEVMASKYVVDELVIGESTGYFVLGENDLEGLFDGKIEFWDDNYGAEETLVFDNLLIANKNGEYNGEAFLEIEDETIGYFIEFDSDFEPLEIGSNDEFLTFNFLGKEMTITRWGSDYITVQRGDSYFLREGQSVDINGSPLTIEFVSETDKVSISYNGEAKTIDLGNSKEIGGIDVFVEELLYSSRQGGIVTIRVGEDTYESYEDGDEFTEDSIWNWFIDGNTLGVVLNENFKGYEVDEDDNAFAYGDVFAFPNDYVFMEYEGLTDEDYFDIKMDLDEEEIAGVEAEHVRLSGDFEFGTDNYDELYVDIVGLTFWGEDDDGDLVDLGTSVIEIENTDYEILASALGLAVKEKGTTVGLLMFAYDFSDVRTNDGSFLDEDEDHINSHGMRVKSFDSDDEEFYFSVPEEQVFAELSFYMG